MPVLSNTGGFTIAGSKTLKTSSPISLIVLDIDNTVFDWVNYYVHAFTALLDHVADVTGVPWLELATEAKDVFTRHGSIEYPFLVQELPSVNQFYGADIDRMLEEAVRIAREKFLKAAEPHLKPYRGVFETFGEIRKRHPDVPIVALTDAPRYVAMWKLNKLGLLNFFDAVYGLADPRIPTCEINRRVKVSPDILFKHLKQHNFGYQGRIRILPDEYEKPGVRGLKTVLMDYELDENLALRKHVIWVGDNLRKDIGLGNKLGVTTGWAEYGTRIEPQLMQRLASFSPTQNIHKNVAIKSDSPEAPKPDVRLNAFEELLTVL